MQITFHGAAGEVTGSCHLLEVQGRRVLLDCGLIQGGRADEARNRDPFPFEVSSVDAVVLSHAHLDHCGRLPLLVKRGFRGPIYAQRASCELVAILLADAARLEARDAEYLTRKLGKRHKPLYTEAHGRAVMGQMQPQAYRQWFDVVPGVRVRFLDAGHIIGSSIVELELEEEGRQRRVVFSGDLGQYDTPILRDPETPSSADLVLMESTYGDRRHRDRSATIEELGEIIARAEGGNILMPAFAIGRSQEILYQFGKHYDAWGLDRFQVFLDSPMAIEATGVYWRYRQLYDQEARQLREQNEARALLPNLHLTRDTEASMAINQIRSGAIIIAGSGMCNGGRIVHHLRRNLPFAGTQVIIPGYQVRGSLGRRLVEGAEHVRIHGEQVPVRAEIHTLGGLSAHADQADLGRWYGGIAGGDSNAAKGKTRPAVRLVHGEPDAQAALADYLRKEFSAEVACARPGEVLALD